MTQSDVITKQFVRKNLKKLLQLEDPCHPERLCNMLSISTISQGTQLMCDLDHDTVKKLHKITDWIALKGQPFSNFKEQLEREQMHGVKYSRAYEKDNV